MTEKHMERRVLVTGGAGGIGLAIARRFFEEGARVWLFDAAEEALATAAEALGEVETFAGSVIESGDVDRCFAAVDERWQGLDCVVNSAGVLIARPALELGTEDWRHVIDVNLTGTWLVCQAAGKRMAAAGSGAIINLSSSLGHGGAPERTAYCASKAGVIGLTRSLAVEWGPLGIRVNSVAPTGTRTAMVQKLIDRGKFDLEAIRRRTPLGRLSEPEEVAAVCSFLASEDAAMVTGHDLAVDGGWLANRYV